MPLIHDLAEDGKKDELIKEIDKNNVNINEKDSTGLTPLYLAAAKGHPEIVDVLLERGADIYMASNRQYTPFFVAIISACDPKNCDKQEAYFNILKSMLIKEAQLRSINPNFKNHVLLKDMKNQRGLTPFEYLDDINTKLYERLNILINVIQNNPANYNILVDMPVKPKEILASKKSTVILGNAGITNRWKKQPPAKNHYSSSEEDEQNIYNSPPAKQQDLAKQYLLKK